MEGFTNNTLPNSFELKDNSYVPSDVARSHGTLIKRFKVLIMQHMEAIVRNLSNHMRNIYKVYLIQKIETLYKLHSYYSLDEMTRTIISLIYNR